MIDQLPIQKNTMEEKMKPSWFIPTCDYYIDACIKSNNKERVKTFIDAANGIVDKATFKYVLEPLSAFDDKLKNLPGEIRNVDIITTVRERQMADYMKLPYYVHVKTNDMETVMERGDKMKEDVEKLMQQAFINMLNKQQDTGVESKQIPYKNIFDKEYINNYIDERAIKGKKRLNLLNDITDFETKRIQAFQYWWMTEEFYTHRWIENEDVRTEVIHPLEGFPLDNGEQFIEDMDAFLWRTKISFPNFIDNYRDKIRPQDIPIVDALFNNYNSGMDFTIPTSTYIARADGDGMLKNGKPIENWFNQGWETSTASVWMHKLVYKTQKPILILTYTDALGKEQETEVPYDYIMDMENGDISVTKDWINTNIIQYRFGNRYDGVYTIPEEEVVQRRDMQNPSRTKLPFGGKRGVLNGIYINPIPYRLLAYEALYQIYTLQLERNIAKYHGDIEILPSGLFNPDASGTTKDKVFMSIANPFTINP